MRVVDAMPRTEAIVGNLIPIEIPHLVNQELSAGHRELLDGMLVRALDGYRNSGAFKARTAAVRKWMSSRERGPLGAMMCVRSERDVELLVYKETYLALAPQLCADLKRVGKVVYLYRDGRDVADSLVRSFGVLTDERLKTEESSEVIIGRRVGRLWVPWWVGQGREAEFIAMSPYGRAAWMWAVMAAKCREEFGVPRGEEAARIMWLGYEELMKEPLELLDRIADHLMVPVTGRMRKRVLGAHRGSIEVYKRSRTSGEVKEAERVAGEELAKYGYL